MYVCMYVYIEVKLHLILTELYDKLNNLASRKSDISIYNFWELKKLRQ